MRKLNEADRNAMRKRVIGVVENGLPPLRWMPAPWFVRTQPWYVASKAADKVWIAALCLGDLRLSNGKLPPALMACIMAEREGRFTPETIVTGNSSGNYAASVGFVAPIFPFMEFRPIIDTKSVPKGKIDQLEANGIREIIPVPEGKIGTDFAYEVAQWPNHYLMDQYTLEASVLGHEWTMNQIIRDLPRLRDKTWQDSQKWVGRDLSGAAAVTGTCSTVAAMHRFLRPAFPDMKVWGIASKDKENKVPGSRFPKALDELETIGGGFDYINAIDGGLITSVTLDEAYSVNGELVMPYGIDVGPTGALALAGTWHRVGEHWMDHGGSFKGLENDAGIVLICLVTIDQRAFYLDDPKYRKYFQ